jgi:hypothetical protein
VWAGGTFFPVVLLVVVSVFWVLAVNRFWCHLRT